MIGNTLRAEGTLKLGKSIVPVKINMNAFRILTQFKGIKLDELDSFLSENELDGMCVLAYAGAKSAAASNGNTFDLDYEVFCAQFLDDENGIKTISELMQSATAGEEEGNTADSGNE